MTKTLKDKLREVPKDPGCYQYFDMSGKLIYVGKAKNLKKRVSQYFQKKDHDPKTRILVSHISDIKWITTGSEMEALILESQLIKRHLPQYNIKIKDDKSFYYVMLDFHTEHPRPQLVRTITRPVADPKLKVFGPYTDAMTLKEGLKVLRRIFRWCELSEGEISRRLKTRRPCFDAHIGYCRGVCAGRISQTEYLRDMRQLALFFEGKKDRLIRDLQKEMAVLAKKKDFERAAILRDRVSSLAHIGTAERGNKKMKAGADQPVMGNQKEILANVITKINSALGYKMVPSEHFRIELYDMSNIQGAEAVGSMVVWQDGEMDRAQYRKFKIKTVKGVNDFAMMREVLARRIKRLNSPSARTGSAEHADTTERGGSEERASEGENAPKGFAPPSKAWRNPDLIILDGGKPQLSTIWQLFEQEGIRVPLIGLAKREEEIWGVDVRRLGFAKADIAKSSPEGFFIQRIRDEAHRFAITYHKKLRRERNITSRLDDISGIGPVTRKKLIRAFGSYDGIKAATDEELRAILGKKTESVRQQMG